ncbi:MAG: hypothetical protein O7H41_01400 [Planctomycetota bacterium]|nr:hypothetical protein [Planctomycetota bacterium]
MRPSVWLFMLVMGGMCLLVVGDSHAWFLDLLATGTLHNLTYFLAWAIVGAVYGLLASFMWLRWARQLGRVRRVLGMCLLVALMMAGSQVAARRVMHPLNLFIANCEWDQDSQEFEVSLASTSQAFAQARRRGNLQVIVSVEGLWWSPSEMKSPQPLQANEVEEFAVGAPVLLGNRQAIPHPPDGFVGVPWHVGEFDVPWKPRVFGSRWAYIARVSAAIVNRDGKRVGGELTRYRVGDSFPPRGWDSADPHRSRIDAFMTEGGDWLMDPDRNRAPFQFRPPPLQGVVREDVRVNPRK